MSARLSRLLEELRPGAYVWTGSTGTWFEVLVDTPDAEAPGWIVPWVLGWGTSPEEAVADAYEDAGRRVVEEEQMSLFGAA